MWQRHWTSAVSAALDGAGRTFRGYRVLAAETDSAGVPHPFPPDLAALERGQHGIVAVVRIDGSVPPADAGALAGWITRTAHDWRAAGVHLTAVEIDHDCSGARLGDYAKFLGDLRAGLPAGLQLSIAALPSWLDAPGLPRLLAAADESVLQAYASPSPGSGRFDPALARRWIDAYGRLSPRPFRVALPAHGARAGLDANRGPDAVEAGDSHDVDARVLRAAPAQVADLLRGLERARPKQLDGIVWFPLPNADADGAWSLATLRAVIRGDPLRPAMMVTFDADASGTHDLVLVNEGAVDAALPGAIVVLAFGCSAGDGVAGYRLERRGDDWRFVRSENGVLRAGTRRHIGWLRCDSIEGMKIGDDK